MKSKKSVLFISIIFILSHSASAQNPTASFAKWKNNTKGVYTLVHDDFGDTLVHGISDYADTIAYNRSVVFTTGAITSKCGPADWIVAKRLMSHGHEIMNHTHNHYCAYDPGWCSTQTWGSLAIELDTSTKRIYQNLKMYPRFFIWPFDITTQQSKDYLKNKLNYYGARGGTQDQFLNTNQLNDANLTDFFSLNFSVLGPSTSVSELNALIDLAISNGKWGMREVHGVNDNSWASVPLAAYRSHCDYIKSKVQSGDLWNANASEVTTYLMQTQNFVPTTTYNSSTNEIVVSFNSPAIDLTDLRSEVTLNINLNGLTGYKYAYQAGQQMTLVDHGTFVSVNCFPHKGEIRLYKTIPSVLSPGSFIQFANLVKKGQQGVIFSVPPMAGYTFVWSYSGIGASFNSSSNSVSIDFSNSATSGTLSVQSVNANGTSAPETINVSVIDVSDQSRCSPGTVTITINGPAGNYEWYDAQKGGSFLSNGVAYTTPSLSATDTFYIDKTSSSISSTIGRTTMGSFWGGSISYAAQRFTVYKNINLISVDIQTPSWVGTGNVYMVLLGSNGNTVLAQSAAVSIGASQTKTITLNFTITPGTYYLVPKGTITDITIASPSIGSSAINAVMSLEGSAYTGSNYSQIDNGDFGPAINWKVSYSPASNLTRVPVVAYINKTPSMPGDFTQKTNPVCPGQSSVVYAVPNEIGNTYAWSYVNGSGFSISAGQGQNSINVNWSNSVTAGTIQVIASNNCGISPAGTLAITIGSVPSSAVITGPNSICSSSSIQTYQVPSVSNVNYTWSISPSSAGTVTGSGNAITVAWKNSGTISCTPNNSCGNGSTSSLNVTYINLPASLGTISGPNTICASASSQTYSVNNLSGITYSWSINPFSAGSISGSGNSVVVNWTNSGTISCLPSNTCGSGPATTLSVSYSDVPSNLGSVAGVSTVCASSSSQIYSVTNVSGVSYSWSIIPSTAGLISGSGNSITVNWTNSGTIKCVPSNSCGNGPSSSLAVSFMDVPKDAGTITGSSNVCSSANTQGYNVAAVSGLSYSWNINPANAGTISGSGNSITVAWVSSGTLICNPSNGCGNGASRSLAVTYSTNPSSLGSISGPLSVCVSSSTQSYSVISGLGITYNWSIVPATSGIINGSGNTISVNWSSAGTIKCIPSNQCGNGPESSLSVTYQDVPASVGNISGLTKICSNSAKQNYSVGSITGINYNWSIVPSTAGIITGSSNTISVNWTGVGKLVCTPSNSCGNGTSSDLTISYNTPPTVVPSIAGSTTVCSGAIEPYSTSTATDVSYSWSISPTNSGVLTTTNSGASVNWKSSGKLICISYNECGNGSSSSISVTVNSKPNSHGVISGNTTICSTSPSNVYSVTKVTGVNYNWTVNPVTAGSVSPSDNSANVIWSSSGLLICTPTNACGSGPSSALSSNYLTSPASAGNILGESSICASAPNKSYSISPINGVNYTWSVTPSSAGTITSTGNAVSVNWKSSGIISVIPSNTCGDGPTSKLSVDYSDVPETSSSILGKLEVCSGVEENYSVNLVAGVNYVWEVLPSNAAAINPSNNAAAVKWQTNGTLKITPTNSCGSGLSQSISIQIKSLPIVSDISGKNLTCLGAQEYSVMEDTSIRSYTWTVDQNVDMVPSKQALSVNWIKAGIYTIGVSGKGQCGTGIIKTLEITVIDKPKNSGTITGPLSLCKSLSKGIYQISDAQGLSYSWTVLPNDAAVISGIGNQVTVDWNKSGNLMAVAYNSCGQGPMSNYSVILNDVPDQPGNFINNPVTEISKGSTAIPYTIPIQSSYTYAWTYSGQGSTIHDSGSNILIDFAPTATSGVLSVVATNACGSSISRDLSLTLITAQPGGFAQFTNPVQKGQESVIYSVHPESGVIYNWTYSGEGVTIHGSGNSISIDFSESATSGTLTVVANDGSGWSAPLTMDITVLSPTAVFIPAAEIIMTAFPNPFDHNSSIEIEVEGNVVGTLEIFDVLGTKVKTILEKEVLAKGINRYVLSEIQVGTYILRFETGSQISYLKVIKN